jgi:predicted HD phosphohydrolase
MIFIKKYFPFTVRSIYGAKRFTCGWQNLAHEEVEAAMRKWLRQQPKDFSAEGFGALVKQWDKCINVGGGYVEK